MLGPGLLESLQLPHGRSAAAEEPPFSLADQIAKYTEAGRRAAAFVEPLEEALLLVGQSQLLRRSLSAELRNLFL